MLAGEMHQLLAVFLTYTTQCLSAASIDLSPFSMCTVKYIICMQYMVQPSSFVHHNNSEHIEVHVLCLVFLHVTDAVFGGDHWYVSTDKRCRYCVCSVRMSYII